MSHPVWGLVVLGSLMVTSLGSGATPVLELGSLLRDFSCASGTPHAGQIQNTSAVHNTLGSVTIMFKDGSATAGECSGNILGSSGVHVGPVNFPQNCHIRVYPKALYALAEENATGGAAALGCIHISAYENTNQSGHMFTYTGSGNWAGFNVTCSAISETCTSADSTLTVD